MTNQAFTLYSVKKIDTAKSSRVYPANRESVFTSRERLSPGQRLSPGIAIQKLQQAHYHLSSIFLNFGFKPLQIAFFFVAGDFTLT